MSCHSLDVFDPAYRNPECAITIYVGSYDCPGTYVVCQCVGVLKHHLSPCSSK